MAAPPSSDMLGDPFWPGWAAPRGPRGRAYTSDPPANPLPRAARGRWPGPRGATGLTRWNGMVAGASDAPTRVLGPPTDPGQDILTVPVDVGRRVLIVANLGLAPRATSATTWASSGLARTLDTWDGPGLIVIAGNLF